MIVKSQCRFIFVSGGVVSSLGKGIAAASIGRLLKENGLNIGILKLDPYLNVDPGTMSPNEHGEVFVTNDGAETDLDLGHYERFLDESLGKDNSVTAGKIYQYLIDKERAGGFSGKTVQVIPHVTQEIKRRILFAAQNKDALIIEVGGTVGDIEALPFLTAVQQLSSELDRTQKLHVHLTWLPEVAPSSLLKTKPTQHSLRELRSLGIMPDILLCRANKDLDESTLEKLHISCSIPRHQIFCMPTTDWVYRMPTLFHEMKLLKTICEKFEIEEKENILTSWNQWVQQRDNLNGRTLKVIMVTKYSSTTDAYKSCQESLQNSGITLNIGVEIDYLDAEDLEMPGFNFESFKEADAILVPGGFGHRGIQGKLAAIKFARENKIPFLGICLGMQLALIEFCRNVLGISSASSTEFEPNTDFPIISLVTEWQKQNGEKEKRSLSEDLGGTLRLGAQTCLLQKGSRIELAYGKTTISERHRHRYEVNQKLFEPYLNHGMVISAVSVDSRLAEAIELNDHPWFVACQYHPEFKSRATSGHPLFISFLKAAIEHSKANKINT